MQSCSTKSKRITPATLEIGGPGGHREGYLAGLVEVWSPIAQVQNVERSIVASKVEEPLRQGREENGRMD